MFRSLDTVLDAGSLFLVATVILLTPGPGLATIPLPDDQPGQIILALPDDSLLTKRIGDDAPFVLGPVSSGLAAIPIRYLEYDLPPRETSDTSPTAIVHTTIRAPPATDVSFIDSISQHYV